MDAPAVLGGLRRRHENSAQPSSKALVAVIDAVGETLQTQGVPLSMSALFAACLSPLEQSQTLQDAEAVTALCTVLAAVMQQLPSSHVRAKFSMISSIICSTVAMLHQQGHNSGVKAALTCLIRTLCGLDMSATWAPVKQPFLMLSQFTMDGNPKVRKIAQEGLAEVIATVRATPAQQHASTELLNVSKMELPAPRLAAKAAADAPQSQRAAAEEAIMKAVQDCLHFMGSLKPVMPVLAEAAALEIAELLLKLFLLGQPLLNRHAADCLVSIASGCANTGNVAPAKLSMLLKAVLAQIGSSRDADTTMRLIQFAEDSLVSLARLDVAACSTALPTVFQQLTPLLAAESDGVRRGASDTLLAVAKRCISADMVETSIVDAAGGGAPRGIARVVLALTSVLGASYQDAWPMALPVVTELLQKLGRRGAPLAVPLIQALADMCRGSADAVEHASLAQTALGTSIAAQGPAAVLEVVPLNLENIETCDTWLVPMLKKYVVGSEMALWGSYMLPRARHVGQLAQAMHKAGKAQEHLLLAALELQMWSCLASFANWATDVPHAMQAFGETLGLAFHNRADLQAPICNTIRRICCQTSAALRHHGDLDGVTQGKAESAGAEDDDALSQQGAEAAVGMPPEDFSLDRAHANRACMRTSAQKWLTELLNRFVASSPEERGIVGETISAVAVLAGEAVAVSFFKECLKKIISSLQALQGQAEMLLGDPTNDVNTYLDLALLLAPGLGDAAMVPLFKAACPALALPSPAVQKKAYKVLAYLTNCRPETLQASAAEICNLLLDGSSVQAAAKRHRLQCFPPVIMLLLSPQCPNLSAVQTAQVLDSAGNAAKQVVASMIAELVLCTKEVNQKTRATSYVVLVRVAHAMHEAYPPQIGADGMLADATNLSNGALQELFSMILAGLASQEPRMVSATVMALARLLFEFGPQLQLIVSQLIPPVCSLLRSKAREVVKSILGFLKVATMRVPVELLTPHLRNIVEGVLLWAEDSKNRFKLKVRHLVERLCKRCGFEAVAAVFPDSDSKLLTAIRKDFARKARKMAAGSSDDGDADMEGDARSRSSMARTARASEWGHTKIFSEFGSDDEGDEAYGAGARSVARQSEKSKAASAKSGKNRRRQGQLSDSTDEPVNLLDMSVSRALVRSAAGVQPMEDEAVEFDRDQAGKMVINEEVDPFDMRRKRKKRNDDSDDSDMDDLKGFAGLDQALKSTDNAKSLRHAKSVSRSHASAVSGKSRRTVASRASSKGLIQGGARFKSKKASGDTAGNAKVEPFAYWKLDRNLLNRRTQKSKGSKSTLGGLVSADMPARGNKAKRQKRA